MGAVIVLAVNDHQLKPAFPGLLTGKLSDVAGLVFAPALLALAFAVFGWAGRRAAAWSVAVTGVGFALVKATPVGADAASALWTAAAGPSAVLADPTDLFALPALGLSWAVHLRSRDSGVGARWVRLVRILVAVPLAVVATAATSQVEPRTVADVRVADGRIHVEGLARETYSGDGGRTWWQREEPEPSPPTQSPSPSARPSPSLTPAPGGATSACLPSRPSHCYRIVPGRLAVEETQDGRVWRTAWEVPEGRTEFLRRQAEDRGLDPLVASSAIAVQEIEGGHVVAVANRGDGLAFKDLGGVWHRLGFASSTSAEGPAQVVWTAPSLDDGNAYGFRLFCVGLMVLALSLGVGLPMSATLLWGVLCAVLGAALGSTLHAQGITVLLSAPVTWALMLAGLVLLCLAVFNGSDRRRALAVAPVALISGLLALLPIALWAIGVLDPYRTAVLLSVLLGCLGVAASHLVGRARRARRAAPSVT
ncbi:hypothetical protein [Actinocorallia aurea]